MKTLHEAAPAQPEPGWLHLIGYGYAPGNYMCRCMRCGNVVVGLDKRATSCKPCAIEAARRALEKP